MNSVDRVDAILASLSQEECELALASVARACDLDRSTTLRYLSALETKGLVERSATTGLYRLGLRLFELGQVAARQRDIRQIALPVMRELSQEHGDTVNLAIFRETDLVILDAVEGHEPIRKGTTVGQSDALHATSLGKAVLSALPATELHDILARIDLKPFTENTITDPEQLIKELAETAERGYAIDWEEGNDGVACVGVAIKDSSGYPRYAVSITGPAFRLSADDLHRIGPVLCSRGLEISLALGFSEEPATSPRHVAGAIATPDATP